MAVPSDNAVIPDKMQFLGRPADVVHHHPNRQWQPPPPQQQLPDERDGFIFWLRGEFAAANAIIDSLCHHLRTTGEPGEYDYAIACIQQRRFNWTPVLHMQQYFSIADVTMALQQATWQKQQQQQQQQRTFEHSKPTGKESRRPSFGYGGYRNNGGNRFEGGRETYGSAPSPLIAKANGDRTGEKFDKIEVTKQKAEAVHTRDQRVSATEAVHTRDQRVSATEAVHTRDQRVSATGPKKEGNEAALNPKMDCTLKDDENATHINNLDSQTSDNGSSSCFPGTEDNLSLDGGLETSPEQDEKSSLSPKVFVANEMCEGKMVNVLEGLKLYESVFDSSDIMKLLSTANELRAAGKRGDLQGQTFIASKRPSRGHGREIIQLGISMHDGHIEDENLGGSFRERKVETLPSSFQDVFARLTQLKIMPVKPDFCVIDFFNEGEYSHPHVWLPIYGRPIMNLTLTECEMVFGRTISGDNKGEYRGALRLSLAAGSLLLIEGKGVDLAKRAISALHKPRVVLTFGKSQSKRPVSADLSRFSSPTSAPLPLGSPLARQMNHPRRPPGTKHYGVVPTSCVLQATHCRPQQLPPNGIQPLFVTQAPVAPSVVPFPTNVPLAPASNGWTVAAPPRQSAPRLPVPGTGVFLPPPGSGSSPTCQPLPLENSNTVNSSSELCSSENDKGVEKSKSDGGGFLKDKADETGKTQNHNGNICSNIGSGDTEERTIALKKKLDKPATEASAK